MLNKAIKASFILCLLLGITTFWVEYQVEGVKAEIKEMENEISKKKLEILELQILRESLNKDMTTVESVHTF